MFCDDFVIARLNWLLATESNESDSGDTLQHVAT